MAAHIGLALSALGLLAFLKAIEITCKKAVVSKKAISNVGFVYYGMSITQVCVRAA